MGAAARKRTRTASRRRRRTSRGPNDADITLLFHPRPPQVACDTRHSSSVIGRKKTAGSVLRKDRTGAQNAGEGGSSYGMHNAIIAAAVAGLAGKPAVRRRRMHFSVPTGMGGRGGGWCTRWGFWKSPHASCKVSSKVSHSRIVVQPKMEAVTTQQPLRRKISRRRSLCARRILAYDPSDAIGEPS